MLRIAHLVDDTNPGGVTRYHSLVWHRIPGRPEGDAEVI